MEMNYISKNYVELIHNKSEEDKPPYGSNQENTNILMYQFNMSDSLYKLKQNCIVLVQFPIVGSPTSILTITDRDRLKQITDLGYEIYDNKKNHLNIKIRFPDEDIWLCNYKFKKGQELLFKDYEPIGRYNWPIIFVFDNFKSEIDYNKEQKQKEQENIYKKEEITNRTIINLEQKINHMDGLLNMSVELHKKDNCEYQYKNKQLEQEITKNKTLFEINCQENKVNTKNIEKLQHENVELKEHLKNIEKLQHENAELNGCLKKTEKLEKENTELKDRLKNIEKLQHENAELNICLKKTEKLEKENAELKDRLKRIEEKLFMSIEHKYF
jgi:hypothetical protein